MNKKKILLICTGGTIASTLKKDGYAPGLTDSDILKSFLERFKMATINHPNLLQIDCTHQTPEETAALIQEYIESKLNK